MEIKSISQKIFRTSSNKVENSNQTNPFGVSFRGNMVSADVFEAASKKSGIIEKVSNRSKMVMSTIVGSINDMNQVISSRFNSVISFGKRLGEKVTNTWNKLDSINICNFNWSSIEGKSRELLNITLHKNPYEGKSVDELSGIFKGLAAEKEMEVRA